MKKMTQWGKKTFLLFLTFVIAAGLSLTLTKPAKAASASLNKTKLTMYTGDSSKLTVKGYAKKPVFKSSRPSIASVTKTGTVTARKAGSCTIRVKAGKKTLSCRITVKKRLELSKYLNKNYTQLKKDAGKLKINKNTPFTYSNQENYISTSKDPYSFMFWANTKTKKLQTLQNTGRKDITLYGVKLNEKISTAHKKLLKKGFKLKQRRKLSSSSPRKELRTYQKSGGTITVSVTKKDKVEYYQWNRK